MPKPSYNPSGVLRDVIQQQGYDPGPENQTNGDDLKTYSLPSVVPPGKIDPLIQSEDAITSYDHPPIASIGKPAEAEYSKHGSGGKVPLPGSGMSI